MMNNSTNKELSNPDLTFLQNLERYAYGYIMLVICLSGILGNILAFAVLSRKSMRSSNTAVYLRCLAVVDTCVLLFAIFRYNSYYVLLPEEVMMNSIFFFDPYVQVYIVPFFWIFLGMSSLVTMNLSLERYLAIRWPLAVKQSCTVLMVRGCIVLIFLLVFFITFPNFLCYNILRVPFKDRSVVVVKVTNEYLDAKAYLHIYNYYIIPIFWYMVPWVVVAIVNVLLSIQVQKSTRIRVGIANMANPNRNLSLLIILIVFIYMVCHFPRCILAIYCLINNCSPNGLGEDVNTKAYYIIKAISEILNILNSCLNIVIYCMAGTRFRLEVKQLLLCRSCCRHVSAQPTVQSVHISLREVPATPVNARKSFNMSYKELQLTPTNLTPPLQGSFWDLQPGPSKNRTSLNLSAADLPKISSSATSSTGTPIGGQNDPLASCPILSFVA